ncbi:MAG: PRC-barrel domain-containing protein [Bdellovibrio sp.]|nr:PRC-barrel domain-containing protein [Bdellovibrio sp.]
MDEEYSDILEENYYDQSLPLIGKHIVSQKEGAHLGDIVDVHIDAIARRISAIVFTKNALGMGDRYYINVDDIESLGEDVVIVRERNCAVKLTESGSVPGKSIDDFKGIRVTTLLGKNLGIIDDIQIRPSNLRIGEFIFDDDKRLVVDASEITMGEDVVLVPEDYTSKVVIKIEQEEGFFGRLKSKERELVNTITDRSREVGRWVSRNVYH